MTTATLLYRVAAWLSAQWLGASGHLQSVAAHRSVATGEVRLARSDIDLVLVLGPDPQPGPALARLHQWLAVLRRFNPALVHLEVYPPSGLQEFAQEDSVWAQMEQRSLLPLWGPRPSLPDLPLQPLHATRRLLLWWEILFCPCLFGRRRKLHLKKACLECWNFFALGRGLTARPQVRRDEMERELRRHGRHPRGDLASLSTAVPFFLGMVQELHQCLRPSLPTLPETLLVTALTAPHCSPTRLWIVPHPQSAIPKEMQAGDLIATPELLDLMVHTKNAFFSWCLPPELGIVSPDAASYRRDAHYLCSAHFLLFPGFVQPAGLHPAVRLDIARLALHSLRQGQTPPPLGQADLSGLRRNFPDPPAYYRHEYEALERQRVALRQELASLP